MKTITISEAKATLSEQLRHVQRGEEVVITDRGRPVARLVPIPAADADDELAELERAGQVRRGSGRLTESFFEMRRPRDAAGSVRAAVLEEREGGR